MGEGGYYARVFLNVQGREPQGVIPPEQYEAVRADLARRISQIPDDRGNPIPAVYTPEGSTATRRVAPDLIVVFGDLYWRSVGTIGGDEGIQTLENDTAPTTPITRRTASTSSPGRASKRRRRDAHLLDIAPTVLEILEIEQPDGLRGRSLFPALAAR